MLLLCLSIFSAVALGVLLGLKDMGYGPEFFITVARLLGGSR